LANPILPVKTEFSSSAANINQLLAAAKKLCLVLGLGAARASLTHSAAHFRYLRKATIECMGAELAFTSSLAIQYKWRPLQDYQPAVEIARRCVNQGDALPVRNSEVPRRYEVCSPPGRPSRVFRVLGACHWPPRRKSTREFRGIGDAERRLDLRTNRSTRWLHDPLNLSRLPAEAGQRSIRRCQPARRHPRCDGATPAQQRLNLPSDLCQCRHRVPPARRSRTSRACRLPVREELRTDHEGDLRGAGARASSQPRRLRGAYP
jgi:hypothetical protein